MLQPPWAFTCLEVCCATAPLGFYLPCLEVCCATAPLRFCLPCLEGSIWGSARSENLVLLAVAASGPRAVRPGCCAAHQPPAAAPPCEAGGQIIVNNYAA